MEQAISEIRREIKHCKAAWEYAKHHDDIKSIRFILGYHSGLEQALRLLNGGPSMVDDEVEAWWNEREAKKRAGTLQVTPWAISVWLGKEKDTPEQVHLFTIHRRAASYVNVLTAIVVFLSKHGIEIGLTEWRD